MPDEKPEAVEEESTYWDDIRADIETAVYALTSFEEMDSALYGKVMQKNLAQAKRDCVEIICKGLQLIKSGYNDSSEED